MAKPLHRVQLHKQESAAGGGSEEDSDPMLYSPLNPDEDAPDVAGVYGQQSGKRDKVVCLYREDDKWYFEDIDNAGVDRKSLNALATGGLDINDVLVDDITLAPLADDVTANLLVNA